MLGQAVAIVIWPLAVAWWLYQRPGPRWQNRYVPVAIAHFWLPYAASFVGGERPPRESSLAAMAGDNEGALELYERSLASFETIGDRAEERAGGDGVELLAHGNSGRARHTFLDSAQAYEDVGSVPGVGISMIGLAAVEAVEGQPKRAVKIAYAAERFSEVEGIVNVYSEDSPGRPYLEAAKAKLSPGVIAEAEKNGRLLTVGETMKMVRG